MVMSAATPNVLPFDDVRALIAQMPDFDSQAAAIFSSGLDPRGRVFEIAHWAAGWQGQPVARSRRPVVALFAASHEVAAAAAEGEQISDIQALVKAVQDKSAAVARVCDRGDLGLKMFELAPELPVADFSVHAAMQESGCAATIAYGMEATTDGCDLLAVRGVAAGDELSVAAIAAILLGIQDDASQLVRKTVDLHGHHASSPLEILRRAGGREAAAVAGAIIAARLQRVPVILDGSLAVCVALLLEKSRRGAAGHCMVSCVDTHRDSARLCDELGRPVLLDGEFANKDGTAGAMAMGPVRAVMELARQPPDGAGQA
jgi:nicotinate-nucleotide--dimethylbenzimidazole phosphoribosyltransferase